MPEMKSLTLNGKQYDSFVDAVARPLSSATAIVRSASGESIVLPDSSDYKMLRLSVYGKSTQDGVPSPDAPVEIVSVANPTITINKVPITVPHSLLGIPVESGGNYTDANGQQWICDEVDLVRGVYVRRVGNKVLDGSSDEVWYGGDSLDNTVRFTIDIYDSSNVGNVVATDFLCTYATPGKIFGVDIEGVQHTSSQFYFRVSKSKLTTGDVDGFRRFLSENPATVVYILQTPVETPLSVEEIATYGALYTTRPSTTLSVNKGAYMSVEYVADTKAYIDSLVIAGGASAGIHNATVE